MTIATDSRLKQFQQRHVVAHGGLPGTAADLSADGDVCGALLMEEKITASSSTALNISLRARQFNSRSEGDDAVMITFAPLARESSFTASTRWRAPVFAPVTMVMRARCVDGGDKRLWRCTAEMLRMLQRTSSEGDQDSTWPFSPNTRPRYAARRVSAARPMGDEHRPSSQGIRSGGMYVYYYLQMVEDLLLLHDASNAKSALSSAMMTVRSGGRPDRCRRPHPVLFVRIPPAAEKFVHAREL